mmetsp:Transcript_58363/g.80966  ORF Transcript_58363/g.80966 Transcript_58363/m.80966 type:complete len:243 (-) Transcript_58363:217-945(-)
MLPRPRRQALLPVAWARRFRRSSFSDETLCRRPLRSSFSAFSAAIFCSSSSTMPLFLFREAAADSRFLMSLLCLRTSRSSSLVSSRVCWIFSTILSSCSQVIVSTSSRVKLRSFLFARLGGGVTFFGLRVDFFFLIDLVGFWSTTGFIGGQESEDSAEGRQWAAATPMLGAESRGSTSKERTSLAPEPPESRSKSIPAPGKVKSAGTSSMMRLEEKSSKADMGAPPLHKSITMSSAGGEAAE